MKEETYFTQDMMRSLIMAMIEGLRKRGLGQETLKKEKNWNDDEKKEESNGLQTLS